MRNHYLLSQICSLLLLIFGTAYYGLAGEYMFHGAIRDKAGNLWFATTGAGVYRYNGATSDFTNFTTKDGLSGNDVGSILEDKAGNLWFNTEHGVCLYDGKTFTRFSTKEGQWHDDIGLILLDRNGNFWFSTNGYGIFRYNPVSGVWSNFTKEQGLGSNTVQCMLEDRTG